MKLKEGTYHVGIGPINKVKPRDWTTYQAGEEVDPAHEEQLKLKGAELIGEVKVESKEEVEKKPFLKADWIKELRKIKGVGKATAGSLAQLYPDKETLIDNLLNYEAYMFRKHKDNVVKALKKRYL